MKTDRIHVRCEEEEKSFWAVAAKKDLMKLPAWIREMLNDAAARRLSKKLP